MRWMTLSFPSSSPLAMAITQLVMVAAKTMKFCGRPLRRIHEKSCRRVRFKQSPLIPSFSDSQDSVATVSNPTCIAAPVMTQYGSHQVRSSRSFRISMPTITSGTNVKMSRATSMISVRFAKSCHLRLNRLKRNPSMKVSSTISCVLGLLVVRSRICITSLGLGPAESISSSGIARETSGPHCHCTIERSWIINSDILSSPNATASCSGVSSPLPNSPSFVGSVGFAHLWFFVKRSSPSKLKRNLTISMLPLDTVAWRG
mmetsp:Transcript_60239/g.134225  ORF Transcript_60239/g.134225 Transcript_60239/m.134225 type:complete len:259 (-) Transcript_60239:246-1022(-)